MGQERTVKVAGRHETQAEGKQLVCQAVDVSPGIEEMGQEGEEERIEEVVEAVAERQGMGRREQKNNVGTIEMTGDENDGARM